MDKNNRTVEHLTQVAFPLGMSKNITLIETEAVTLEQVKEYGKQWQNCLERTCAMMEILTKENFSFQLKDGYVIAQSHEMEAQEIKRKLLSQGFRDEEFQIQLEYFRKWGMM